MEESKILPCKICLNVITDERYKVIEETIKSALDALLLNLGVEESNKPAICNDCFTKLFAAFDFKVTCLNIERTISAYANSANMAQVDLREVYLKDRGKKRSKSALKDEQICRLCMQMAASEFKNVNDVESNLIKHYIPEVNFSITSDPVICQSCFYALHTHSDFLKHFSAAEGHGDGPFCIKTEEIEIKLERFEDDSEMPSADDKLTELNSKDPLEIQACDSEQTDFQTDHNDELQNVPHLPLTHKRFYRAQMYKYDAFALGEKCDEQKYGLLEDNIKCESQHLIGKNFLEARMYECATCQFKTKYKSNLTHHQLVQHAETSEVQIYKCDKCQFQTKHKKSLMRHGVVHKDTTEIQMYKCDKCPFQTKHKKSLSDHEPMHKNASEVQMYKCNECSYETKRKVYFRSHQRKHKNVSEVQVYRCGVCDYVTKYKSNFTQHEVIHKDVSKVEMYKCDKCSYETKRKRNLVSHELKHKGIGEVQMYKCDSCSYETKYKTTLLCHQLRHKDVSEVQMYRCGVCSYETRFKKHLRGHEAVHKDNFEV